MLCTHCWTVPRGKVLSLQPSEGLGGRSVSAVRSRAALITPVCRVLGAHACVHGRGTAGLSSVDPADSLYSGCTSLRFSISSPTLDVCLFDLCDSVS